MNRNTDHLKTLPYVGGAKRGRAMMAFGIGSISGDGKGKFLAKMNGSHEHKWIFGDQNAVCTKCGYTLNKELNLPQKGK